MSVIPWVQYTESIVGLNHPTLPDTINRALRQVLTASGLNPDADFGSGFALSAHNQSAATVTSGTFPGAYSITGLLTLLASLSFPSDTANYPRVANVTLTSAQCFLGFDCTSGNKVATLPLASSVPGQVYIVVKIDASVNTLTFTPSGADLISGAASKVISTQWAKMMVISNGSTWFQLI